MYSSIVAKRIYEPVEASDGTRLLIDGIWPRGIARSAFPDDAWRPDLAPSRELRQWYQHQPDLFDEFRLRYRRQLADNDEVAEVIRGSGRLTLLTATRRVEISHAAVLCEYLREVCDL
ncbi:MAG: DUF488 family protein [Acidimicrobiia bacterium]|nr:DUF488 family protein [Acidimicrobiia bacterium]